MSLSDESLLFGRLILSLCLFPLLPPLASSSPRYHQNSFIQTCHLAAQELNEQDCWVCSHMPTHQGSTFELQAVPANISLLLVPSSKELRVPATQTLLSVQHQATFPICFIWLARPGVTDVGSTTRCQNTITRSSSDPPSISGQLALNSSALRILFPDTNFTDFAVPPAMILACRVWKNILPHTCPFVEPWGPPEDIFWVCGSAAYKQLPANWTGSCALSLVVPAIRIVKVRPEGKIRNARDLAQSKEVVNTYHPLTDLDLYGSALVFPQLGVVRVGWAVYRLQAVIDMLSNETSTSLETLAYEQRELRKVALQNRLALDMILASSGGACALIGTECCVYVPETSEEIFDHARHIAALGAIPVDVSRTWLLEAKEWLGSWWGKLATYVVVALLTLGFILLAVRIFLHYVCHVFKTDNSKGLMFTAPLEPMELDDEVAEEEERVLDVLVELYGIEC